MQSPASQFAFALILVIAGLCIVYSAWRRPARSWIQLSIGWGSLVVSFPFWSDAAGIDVGPAVAITLASLIGISLVLANGNWTRRARAERKRTKASSPLDESAAAEESRAAQTTARIIAAGPLGFVASCTLTLLFVAFSSAPESNRIVIAACLMVTVWSALMVWACSARAAVKPLASMFVIALASSLLLYVGA